MLGEFKFVVFGSFILNCKQLNICVYTGLYVCIKYVLKPNFGLFDQSWTELSANNVFEAPKYFAEDGSNNKAEDELVNHLYCLGVAVNQTLGLYDNCKCKVTTSMKCSFLSATVLLN